MSSRALRRIWFLGLFLLCPWPMPVFHDALVPAVRYVLLGAAAVAVAVTEGTSGPVGLVVGLLTVMAVATTAGCWGLAWGIERLLRGLPPRARVALTWGSLGIALALALRFAPYRTSFGRALTGGLLQVLS